MSNPKNYLNKRSANRLLVCGAIGCVISFIMSMTAVNKISSCIGAAHTGACSDAALAPYVRLHFWGWAVLLLSIAGIIVGAIVSILVKWRQKQAG